MCPERAEYNDATDLEVPTLITSSHYPGSLVVAPMVAATTERSDDEVGPPPGQNDGSARQALLIFVCWSPALPNLLVSSPPHSSLNLAPIISYVSIGTSGVPHNLSTPNAATLYKSLDQSWTPN